ncbi:hypothetical protein [Empedobacter sp.]|uniref:terminase small subunit-like protein n=1 Tax=Empedobacter sp. TaxID=1927715 RepID=UPI0028A8A128|nr:hypothetical protein [Empedobacter sp.]
MAKQSKSQIVKEWKSSDIKIKKDSKGLLWAVLGKGKVKLPKDVVAQTLKLQEAEQFLNSTKKEDVKIDKDYIFSLIITSIENGLSFRKALKSLEKHGLTISSRTFFQMIESDEEKVKQYARACEARADAIFEEILDIADCEDEDIIGPDDGEPRVNHDVIQRDRLRVDARKWILAKMNPKKYGDKIDHTSNGETITTPARILTKKEAQELYNSLENDY